MYELEISPQFEKKLLKLKKKNKTLFLQTKKKLIQIVQNPQQYKPVRNELAGFRRVHVNSFVIIFKIVKNKIKIISLEHHDDTY